MAKDDEQKRNAAYYQRNKERIKARTSQYYKEHKEEMRQRRSEYAKQYREDNAGKIKAQSNEYRETNKEAIKERRQARAAVGDESSRKKRKRCSKPSTEETLAKRRQYYLAHKDKASIYAVQHRDHIYKVAKQYRTNTLAAWEQVLLQKYGAFNCECCGVPLTFQTAGDGKVATAIQWDHRIGTEEIKAPFVWLVNHFPTEENIAIWSGCDFGMVCSLCNFRLGTPVGREARLLLALSYIDKSEARK
jgi:hypothetical protein